MTETIFIRPATAGAVIPDPSVGEPLPADGKAVPRNAYWLGLLARGDIEECEPPTATETTESAPASAPTVSKEA